LKTFLRTAVAALVMAIPSLTIAATFISAPHGVSNEELQRFIYAPNYPNWCGASGQAAREMRVNPTTDPKTLHGIMRANIVDCANSSYAQSHQALWNTAVFGAAAAALLAARHEPPAPALRDATHAKNWGADLVKFTYQRGTYRASGQPSQYRTDAGRINRDAIALINAIVAHYSGAPAPDSLPAHIKPPGQ
jgi:hypothetical protein